MVKIFIGNLSQNAEKEEIEALFAQYGTVTECAKYKNYAFVHMDDRKSATKAIRELQLYRLHGRQINVEPSRAKNRGPVKIHVANVEKGSDEELRAMFEEYGTVTECAIIKNFAFVHMANSDEAMDAIRGLDYCDFHGRSIHVQISKSRPRGGLGMEEYGPPPLVGAYYPPHFPEHRPEPPFRGHMPGYPTPPPPPASPPRQPAYQPGCLYSERDVFGPLPGDYYKYPARPFNAPAFDRPSPIPPPPSPSGVHLAAPLHDPYGLHPLPPPPPPPAYCGRDHSPHRRVPPPAFTVGNTYSYESSLLSSVPGPPVFASPHHRDPFTERVDPFSYYWEPRKYTV